MAFSRAFGGVFKEVGQGLASSQAKPGGFGGRHPDDDKGQRSVVDLLPRGVIPRGLTRNKLGQTPAKLDP